ncbi:MAG: extracellular solute-binding protein [Deltaproteobacteria bacterium]|nr:extracellular solute-binding protein [Deltaproteobacteria bacterium]
MMGKGSIKRKVVVVSLFLLVPALIAICPHTAQAGKFEKLMKKIKWRDNIVERLTAKEWRPPRGWEFIAKKVKEISWLNAGALKYDPAIVIHQKKFAERTGIKVKNIVTPDTAIGSKAISMFTARSGAATAIHLSPGDAMDFARAGWTQTIDQMWSDESKTLYAPGAIFNCTYQGHMYAVPAMGRTHQLLYRKDLLQKYVGTTKPPETWQELIDYGKKLTVDTNGDGNPDIWGFVYYATTDACAWQIQQMMYLQGVRARNIVDAKGVAHYDTPEGIRALQFLTDLVQRYKISPPGVINYWDVDLYTMFMAGKVAMAVTNNWVNFKLVSDKEKFPSDKWGIAALPACGGWDGGPKGSHYPRVDAYSAAINSYADPYKKVAAALYLDCVRSYESNKDEQVVEQNLALMPKIYDDPEVQQKTYGYKLMKWSLENGQSITYQQASGSYLIIADYGPKAITGEMSPKEALEKAQKEYEARLWF